MKGLLFLLPLAVSVAQVPPQTFPDTSLARALFGRGKELQKSADFKSAISLFDSASAIYGKAGNLAGRIRSTIETGVSWRQLGKYEAAIGALALARAEEQDLENNHPPVAVQRLLVFASVFLSQGDLDTAMAVANRAHGIFSRNSLTDKVLAWDLHSLFGSIYFARGEHDSAAASHRLALDVFVNPEGDERMKVSGSYNSLALIYDVRGEYEKSRDYYLRSLEIHRAALGNSHPEVAILYNNVATMYMRLGDYETSLEYHHRSLAILSETLDPNHPSFAIRYNNVAMVYRNKGDFVNALKFGQSSREVFAKSLGERHMNTGIAINNLGRTYSDMKDFRRALELYGEAREIWEEKLGRKHPNVAQVYFNIGEAFGNLGEWEKASANIDQSLRIRRETMGEKNVKVAQSYNALGKLNAQRGNLNTALSFRQKALIALVADFRDSSIYANPPTLKSSSNLDLLEALTAKAEILRRRYDDTKVNGDLIASLDAVERAAELVESIRRGFLAEGSKLQLAQSAFKVYEQGIRTAGALFDRTKNPEFLSTAFSFAERSKAGILLEAIAESNARRFGGIPEDLLERESSLRADLAHSETQLQKEKDKGARVDKARISGLEGKVFSLRQSYSAMIQTFEQNYPEYFSLKHRTGTVSLSQVRSTLLDENSALLEYVAGDSSLIIIAVKRNEIVIRFVHLPASLGSFVRDFRRSIQNLDIPGYLELGTKLYAHLVAPVRNELTKIKTLYIVPDGVLNYVPFEALLSETTGATSPADFSDLPYLLRDFEISYHASAGLLVETILKPGRNEGFVGFAPVFAKKPLHAKVVYSQGVSAVSSTSGKGLRSGTAGDESFAELKESEQEVQTILRLLETEGIQGTVYLHEEANESALKSGNAANKRFLHLATHGLINEKQPKLSGIVLAAPKSGSADDGILYLGEIYNLRLKNDLVVLSACETGLGTIAKGEGILGLTRGFTYAGARNLLVSLWQVADKSTSELMVRFYGEVLEGRSYTAALRNAKLMLINTGTYAHPVEWSPFVLTGR